MSHKIPVLSADKESFELDYDVIKQSGTLSTMLTDLGIDILGEEMVAMDAIVLSNCNSNIIKRVITWCNFHKNDPPHHEDGEQREKRTDDIPSWDVEFLKVDQGTLFELILAANYLDIKGLLDVTCKTVANMIKGKSPDEIRRTFNIRNDFTAEEEEQIKKENAWCYSKKSLSDILSNHDHANDTSCSSDGNLKNESGSSSETDKSSFKKESKTRLNDYGLTLIWKVKNEPCLYNPDDAYYGNKPACTTYRTELWCRLAKELNYAEGGPSLQIQWKRLRDRYVKLRRRKRIINIDDPRIDDVPNHMNTLSSIRLCKEMAWIDPYLVDTENGNAKTSPTKKRGTKKPFAHEDHLYIPLQDHFYTKFENIDDLTINGYSNENDIQNSLCQAQMVPIKHHSKKRNNHQSAQSNDASESSSIKGPTIFSQITENNESFAVPRNGTVPINCGMQMAKRKRMADTGSYQQQLPPTTSTSYLTPTYTNHLPHTSESSQQMQINHSPTFLDPSRESLIRNNIIYDGHDHDLKVNRPTTFVLPTTFVNGQVIENEDAHFTGLIVSHFSNLNDDEKLTTKFVIQKILMEAKHAKRSSNLLESEKRINDVIDETVANSSNRNNMRRP
uniref:MADF domain-containing protein n=1 Tax=Rhabditophanes sp. KR3021 TaxID=114890 RepID=A0AC35TIR2_9BILA